MKKLYFSIFILFALIPAITVAAFYKSTLKREYSLSNERGDIKAMEDMSITFMDGVNSNGYNLVNVSSDGIKVKKSNILDVNNSNPIIRNNKEFFRGKDGYMDVNIQENEKYLVFSSVNIKYDHNTNTRSSLIDFKVKNKESGEVYSTVYNMGKEGFTQGIVITGYYANVFIDESVHDNKEKSQIVVNYVFNLNNGSFVKKLKVSEGYDISSIISGNKENTAYLGASITKDEKERNVLLIKYDMEKDKKEEILLEGINRVKEVVEYGDKLYIFGDNSSFVILNFMNQIEEIVDIKPYNDERYSESPLIIDAYINEDKIYVLYSVQLKGEKHLKNAISIMNLKDKKELYYGELISEKKFAVGEEGSYLHSEGFVSKE